MTGLPQRRLPECPPAPGVRAGVLINHPIQHIVPGLRALARQAGLRPRVYYWQAEVDGRLDVEFGRHVRWEADLHSGYDWWAPPADRPAGTRALAVLRRLRCDRPEVLLAFGWRSPVARLGVALAHASGTPLLYYGDSHPGRSVTGRDRLRRPVLRALFRAAAGAVTTGAGNREFYQRHGLAGDRIYPGVLPADVELFAAAARRCPPDRRPAGPVIICCAAKFVPHKAVGDLVAAAARLPARPSWRLWLIGDGPLRDDLARQVARHRLTDRVDFLGFRNLDTLPSLLAASDIVVTPSHRDNRPLVVLEAMAAGSAVVVSSATGLWGPDDVVEPGRSGLVFPASDVDALADRLRRLLVDPDLRTRLGTAAHARAAGLGPDTFATTTASALRAVARGSRRVAGG